MIQIVCFVFLTTFANWAKDYQKFYKDHISWSKNIFVTSGESLLSHQRPRQHPEPEVKLPLSHSPSITPTTSPLLITISQSTPLEQRQGHLFENQVRNHPTPSFTLPAPAQHKTNCPCSPCQHILVLPEHNWKHPTSQEARQESWTWCKIAFPSCPWMAA